MNLQLFRKNRARISLSELAKYRGQWIAFSDDGSRILAGAAEIGALEEQLAILGHDPQTVFFDYVPDPDDGINIGGVETV